MEIAKMADKKDTENKSFHWKVIGAATLTVISIVGVGAGTLGGKFDFELPKPNI